MATALGTEIEEEVVVVMLDEPDSPPPKEVASSSRIPAPPGDDAVLSSAPRPPSVPAASPQPLVTVKMVQAALKEEDIVAFETERKALMDLKKELVVAIKNIFVLERSLRNVEGKIKLLIRNHVAAEEMKRFMDRSLDKIRVKRVTDTVMSNDRFKAYGNLIYQLQKNTQALATLTRLVRLKNMDNFLQTVVFTLYGDAFSEREENLLLALFEQVLQQEFQNCQYIGEFMRSNTAFTRMLHSLLQRSQYRAFLSDVIAHPIRELLADTSLNLELNPSRVYSSLVEECKR